MTGVVTAIVVSVVKASLVPASTAGSWLTTEAAAAAVEALAAPAVGSLSALVAELVGSFLLFWGVALSYFGEGRTVSLDIHQQCHLVAENETRS